MTEPNTPAVPMFVAPSPAAETPERGRQAERASGGQSSEPPWGAEFDPARAWHTITSLREREKELSKQVLTPEQQQQLDEYQRLVEASKSEQQRKDEALAAAQRDIENARAEAVRYKAAATFGVPQEHFDLLGTGTEEEVSARAEKIRNLLAAQAAAATPPATTPPTRPVEQLRPGATPGEVDNEEELLFQHLGLAR